MLNYRLLKPTDAAAFYALSKRLDQETPFMLYLPEERQKNLPALTKMLENANDIGLLMGAWNQSEELIGFISAQGSPLKKIQHTAYIVIGIINGYQGQGVGSHLFSELEEWAKKRHLHRLELTVTAENLAGVHLYQKKGFVIEGIKKDSIFMDNRYLDEYYMAKLL